MRLRRSWAKCGRRRWQSAFDERSALRAAEVCDGIGRHGQLHDYRSLQSETFFNNLGAPLATHRDIRYAKTIVLIGGDPGELQPLTGKQIRQAVRNGGAKLVLVNSVPIRLREQATMFLHVRPGTEDAIVLALADLRTILSRRKKPVSKRTQSTPRDRRSQTLTGDVVIMFGHELSS